jgi:hypothetical protein
LRAEEGRKGRKEGGKDGNTVGGKGDKKATRRWTKRIAQLFQKNFLGRGKEYASV